MGATSFIQSVLPVRSSSVVSTSSTTTATTTTMGSSPSSSPSSSADFSSNGHASTTTTTATTTAAAAAAAAHYVTMMNINLNMAMCSSQHHHHSPFNTGLMTTTTTTRTTTTTIPTTMPQHKSLPLRLPDDMYAWLESMAMEYNYGSVHKCIRDLLAWACTGERDDLDWVFNTFHPCSSSFAIPNKTYSSSSSTTTSSSSSSQCYYDTDALAIVGKQACARLESSPMVAINARVSDCLHRFVVDVVKHYHLQGPSDVLQRIVYCAVELCAAHDIFDSHESGHDLAESTAELYHDLGLIRYVDNNNNKKTHHHHLLQTSSCSLPPLH